ncbi:MAG: hypothetical protein JSS83_12065 [Cyanobacteria bacterium SZAS LIN-3]|nr:hypothetical protein [Cyanobacteria bacterium SZAS LIN-3]
MRIRRRDKGSVIAFSTVLALVLVLLGVAFVFLLMYMGGQHETKNATDAGALNVGKQALDKITVNLQGGDEQIYQDVTNDVDDGSQGNDGKISLRRINRVWAKAMLIGINADAMAADGLGGSASGNASQAFTAAKSISDRLAQKLNATSNLYDFFSEYSKANSVRMIGNSVETDVLPGANWKTSLMDRTPITSTARESNITLSNGPNNGMPYNYTLNGGYVTGSTRTAVSAPSDMKFLKGYTALNVAGNDIWQVPFQYDEKPRLVSRTMFDKSTNSANPLAWDNAVPNAFSVEGQAIKPGAASEKAMSWVLTNPRESFQMAIPHSFLKIHLDEMKAHWYFFPTGYPPIEMSGAETTYGYMLKSGSAAMPQGGAFCSLVDSGSVDELGSDVVGRSLDDVIFSIPGGNTAELEAHMVNRCNEMLTKVGSSVSPSQMHSLLDSIWTRADLAGGSDSGRDFYVYSSDGVNLSLCSDLTINSPTVPMWLKTMVSEDPDGTEKTEVDDASSFAPIIFMPTATPDPFCTVDFTFGWGTWEKSLYWKPGSGFNGDLGQVRVKRWTNVYSFGLATPII